MSRLRTDAIVIGAGPNGLVAANLLADRGWLPLVVEAETRPGGAVKSGRPIEAGFVTDLFSAFYPLAAASPWIRSLALERWGLEWRRTGVAVAHQHPDGRSAAIHRDTADTAGSFERFAPGDGQRWLRLYREWQRIERPLVEALFAPLPPVRPAFALARSARRDLLRYARAAVMSARRLGVERFRGEGGRWLIAGNALHADLTPDMAGGGFIGMLLCGLGQSVGFPFPAGGAVNLTEALVARLEASGGKLRCGARVNRIVVEDGRVTGISLTDGSRLSAGSSWRTCPSSLSTGSFCRRARCRPRSVRTSLGPNSTTGPSR